MAEKLGHLLDGLNEQEKTEVMQILGDVSGRPGQGAHLPDVVPDYATYYNQTDEKIHELIEKAAGQELDRWHGIVSHLNATTLLVEKNEILNVLNEIEIAYWEDVRSLSNESNRRTLNGLRYWCKMRIYDAHNGHRAGIIKERVSRNIWELSSAQRKRRILGL